jgi:hypothetical protein
MDAGVEQQRENSEEYGVGWDNESYPALVGAGWDYRDRQTSRAGILSLLP